MSLDRKAHLHRPGLRATVSRLRESLDHDFDCTGRHSMFESTTSNRPIIDFLILAPDDNARTIDSIFGESSISQKKVQSKDFVYIRPSFLAIPGEPKSPTTISVITFGYSFFAFSEPRKSVSLGVSSTITITIPVTAQMGSHLRKLASWAEKFLAGTIATAERYTDESVHRIGSVHLELTEGGHLRPFVTIITVEKDDPVGLKRTALSILGQSSSQFEWVVVSSSLKFDSLSLLESLSDDHRVTIVHQTAKGIYPAMNFGAEVASGRYLWFINAGDFLLGPSSVSDVILDLQIDSPGLLLTSVVNVTLSGFIYGFTHPKALTLEKNLYVNVNHQGSLVSLGEFERVGGFDESYSFAADGNFLDKVANGGKYRISDLVLVAFTLGGASSTSINKTLAEISRYRPRSGSQALERWILFKTRLRNWMIESAAAQIFANFYLARREKREIISCGGASFYIFDKHWQHRTQKQQGVLTCCFW